MDTHEFLRKHREEVRRLRSAMVPDDLIRVLADDSDIPLDGDLYREIADSLVAPGLNLSFFTFQTRGHSSCARQGIGTCPALRIFLRHDADFRATGVSAHRNNWGDEWSLTATVRDALNAIHRARGYDGDYVSDHTFVFLRTLEEQVRHNLGCFCKGALRQAIKEHAPCAQIDRTFDSDRLYWTGESYHVAFRDEAEWKWAERVKDRIKEDVQRAFAEADVGQACQSYEFELIFSDPKGAIPMISRDDICED